MELYELLNFFEEFYGEKYAGAFLEAMADYLDGYSREFYLAVRKVMVLRFSRTYNKAPGPAEIERHMEEIVTVMDAMPKPLLPEPEKQYATPEEAREWLREIKGMVSKGTGPLAGVMIEATGGE